MTEWEQIKNEYKDVPVPAEGLNQVLQAMAEAKRNRRRCRVKNIARYGTVAAAVLLVVLVVPGMLLFSGGFGGVANDAASTMMDTTAATEECLPDSAVAETEREDGLMEKSASFNTAAGGMVKEQEAISKEILRQMEERMQKNGETYYIRSEEYPEGFALISEEQEFYINEEGLLVFVFRAGTVAPKEQGDVEFIIPAEVAVP